MKTILTIQGINNETSTETLLLGIGYYISDTTEQWIIKSSDDKIIAVRDKFATISIVMQETE